MKVNAAPMNQKLWTKGFTTGVVIIIIGAIFSLLRFIDGIGSVTNLSDGVPWGLWITFDVVTGIAMAAGGFTMAALVYIFNRGQYSPLIRPALLTALLGYGLAAFAIIMDVGRWWQIYNPVLPWNWQGNSPLFEVSLCVMSYVTVLFLEFIPIMAEKWTGENVGFIKKLLLKISPYVNRFLIVLIILGVVISSLHQSSLGAVMLIAVNRIEPLWWSPWLPLMFLTSAVAIGYPMVIFEAYLSSKTFKRKVEINVLSKLAKITPWILGFYLLLKAFDLVFYNKLSMLISWWGLWYVIELLLFAIIPFIMLRKESVRNNIKSLFNVSAMMIAGLVLNRFNTYLITYSPRPGWDYFPSIGELAISAMMVAALFVLYKIIVNNFPVLSKEEHAN